MNDPLIYQGLKAAETSIADQNFVWSRFSGDKPDVGKGLMRALHFIACAKCDHEPVNIISMGCGAEPQLRVLAATNYNHIVLLDNDAEVLTLLKERVKRQFYPNILPVLENYEAFLDLNYIRAFLKVQLNGQKADVIFLHHSLYYLPMEQWLPLFCNIYNELLAPNGIIHSVLMSRFSDNVHTTSWLCSHYCRRYFNRINNQSLLTLQDNLMVDNCLEGSELSSYTSEIKFWVNDFELFMQVIWMILLYPSVYFYEREQMEEITRDTHAKFFLPQRPLLQSQDHLFIQKSAV